MALARLRRFLQGQGSGKHTSVSDPIEPRTLQGIHGDADIFSYQLVPADGHCEARPRSRKLCRQLRAKSFMPPYDRVPVLGKKKRAVCQNSATRRFKGLPCETDERFK